MRDSGTPCPAVAVAGHSLPYRNTPIAQKRDLPLSTLSFSPIIANFLTRASPSLSRRFAKALEGAFPRALPEADFQECMSAVLIDNGFNPDNSINMVATCRDELCRPFTDGLDSVRPATSWPIHHTWPHPYLGMRSVPPSSCTWSSLSPRLEAHHSLATRHSPTRPATQPQADQWHIHASLSLSQKWAHHFDIGALAGFVLCGKTGFKAAFAHSPVEDGKERYVFWVAPHIGTNRRKSLAMGKNTSQFH